MQKQVNLVLQGGGVRGIAYVGALESLPPDITLHTVAGTSAGSIVAAMLALGRGHAEIAKAMNDLDFAQLLDPIEQKRMTRLRWIFGAAGGRASGMRLVAGILGRSARSFFRPWFDIEYLLRHRGMHQSDGLKRWLDKLFGANTFNHIKTHELYVVASDVSLRDFVIFSKEKYPSKRLSEAVLASASIPLFFRPVVETDRALVDGGMLSNFPSHLFARAEYPTVGLRLEGSKKDPDVSTFARFLGGLLDTMLEAHDKERTPQAHFTQYTIDTGDISSVDFNLTQKQKKSLVESGRETGRWIPWKQIATTHPVLKFTDHHPDDILSWSLEQAGAAAIAAENKTAWCEELRESVFLDYFFEENWGSRLIFKFEYEVAGNIPFFARRFEWTTPPQGQGMMDCLPNFDCSPGPPDFNVHLVPWAADDDHKGFVILMIPPISKESGRRRFTIRYAVQGDHALKLSKRGQDKFSLPARRRAHKHRYSAVARFWHAKRLGADIQVTCPNSWSENATPPASPYDETYNICGVFTGIFELTGDVTNDFGFRRLEGSEF